MSRDKICLQFPCFTWQNNFSFVCCPAALNLKFKSAVGVWECFEQKLKTSPSHSSEYFKVLSQFSCGLGNVAPSCAIEGFFSHSYVTEFILIPNWEVCWYILLRTFGLQKSCLNLKPYGGYEIEANNLNTWKLYSQSGVNNLKSNILYPFFTIASKPSSIFFYFQT